MSIALYRPESPFDFTPEPSFRGSTIGERFTIQKNPWGKQDATADSHGFPLG